MVLIQKNPKLANIKPEILVGKTIWNLHILLIFFSV
jgi:hypothetical protein